MLRPETSAGVPRSALPPPPLLPEARVAAAAAAARQAVSKLPSVTADTRSRVMRPAEDPNLGSRFCSGIAVANQKSAKPARFTFNVHLSKPKDPVVAANTRPKVDGITTGARALLIASCPCAR